MKFPSHTVVPLGFLLVSLLGCDSRTHEITQRRRSRSFGFPRETISRTPYIDTLKSTRSAFKAGETGQMNLVVVHRQGTKFLLQPIFNFHEGGSEFAIHEDGSVSSVEPVTEYTRNPSAHVLDDHTFAFGFAEFKPVKFVFVKDAAAYVSSTILVGKYQDKQGRPYEFRGDGWAIFPDRKFKFEIGTDHVFDDFDYFMESKKTWAFKRNGSLLQIFPTVAVEDFDQISSDRPYLSLKEVR